MLYKYLVAFLSPSFSDKAIKHSRFRNRYTRSSATTITLGHLGNFMLFFFTQPALQGKGLCQQAVIKLVGWDGMMRMPNGPIRMKLFCDWLTKQWPGWH